MHARYALPLLQCRHIFIRRNTLFVYIRFVLILLVHRRIIECTISVRLILLGFYENRIIFFGVENYPNIHFHVSNVYLVGTNRDIHKINSIVILEQKRCVFHKFIVHENERTRDLRLRDICDEA